ncbi:hypothetical protein OBBRIDRAFT_733401, partial [Obba rivulosa]
VYAHILTLSKEVECIWGRPLNSVTVLFHLNRYMTLAWAVLQNIPTCVGQQDSASVISPILYVLRLVRMGGEETLSEFLILSCRLRIYVASMGNRLLALVVFSLNMVQAGTNTVCFSTPVANLCTFLAVLICMIIIHAVIPVKKNATRVCVIAADIFLLSIIWTRTCRMIRSGERTPVVSMLLRDGMRHYFLNLFSTQL